MLSDYAVGDGAYLARNSLFTLVLKAAYSLSRHSNYIDRATRSQAGTYSRHEERAMKDGHPSTDQPWQALLNFENSRVRGCYYNSHEIF